MEGFIRIDQRSWVQAQRVEDVRCSKLTFHLLQSNCSYIVMCVGFKVSQNPKKMACKSSLCCKARQAGILPETRNRTLLLSPTQQVLQNLSTPPRNSRASEHEVLAAQMPADFVAYWGYIGII